MRRPRPRRRFDFDARSLLIVGAIYLAIGVGIYFFHPVMPDLFHTQLPVPTRVFLWSGFGLIAVIAGILSRRNNWITGIGFAVLFIGPAQRAASYGWALILDAIGPHSLNWAYFNGFCLYLLQTALIVHLAKGDEDAGKSAAVIVAEVMAADERE